ncbi:hypothetical protein [Mesorhizobium loti]|uniref:Uncharacterized protein n=1 Tax=Mesorhizobium loti R88b TaxID=935548 RepID=A0A6M7WWJ4_RHILI|nr:hypothetical protein [Mesorhizobium loti]QKD03351.1 hypothetical protein EB235_19075 [Mesorhizobium loti R88b]
MVRVDKPRLKAKYIEDRLLEVKDRPWTAEISGRLLSKAVDIEQKAVAEANKVNRPGIRFRAVAIAKVEAIEDDYFDVFAEPKGYDPAHANIVLRQPMPTVMVEPLDQRATPKVSHEFVKRLCDKFDVYDAVDVQKIEALRVA